MNALDAALHFANFLLPALLLGAVAAGLAKLLWRRALRTVAWSRLAATAAAAAIVALCAGLVLSGRDGAVLTYAAMVVACAGALGWVGWGRR